MAHVWSRKELCTGALRKGLHLCGLEPSSPPLLEPSSPLLLIICHLIPSSIYAHLSESGWGFILEGTELRFIDVGSVAC